MPSQARKKFLDNRKVVEDLLGIHAEHSGTGPGRREERLEVLNKSAIVFVTACWEAYVEDVAQEAFLFMLEHMGAADFPTRVRVLAGERLRVDKDARRIWDLAGDGWKTVVRRYLEEEIESFHTPKSSNVDDLLTRVLDKKDVSVSWKWQNMSFASARKKLDDYVRMRGDIAHRTRYESKVYKGYGADYLRHIDLLVEKTDESIAEYIRGKIGKEPWE